MFKNLKYTAYRIKQKLILTKQGLLAKLLYFNPLKQKKKQLLILKLDSIGDYILFRNFIKIIKESTLYKDYEITLCGNEWWKDISEELDKEYISEYVWVSYNNLKEFDYSYIISKKLFSKRFDVALTPTYSRCTLTDKLMLQSGAKYKIAQKGNLINKYYRSDKTEKKYDLLVDDTNNLDFEFELNKNFIEKILNQQIKNIYPSISSDAQKLNHVVICVGAKFEFRQWSSKNYYDLANYIFSKNKNIHFYICGSENENHLASEILKYNSTLNIINLCGKLSLTELKKIISQALLVLCNDSGPYHLASALNTPLICISNGNHYARFCPYPKNYNKKNLEIFPNSLNVKHLTKEDIYKLQTEGSAININEISVEQVINQIETTNFLSEISINHNY